MSNQVYKDNVNKYTDPVLADLNLQIDAVLATFKEFSFTTTFVPTGATLSISGPIDLFLTKYEKMGCVRMAADTLAYNIADPATDQLQSSSAMPADFNLSRHFPGLTELSAVQQEIGFCNFFAFSNIYSSVSFVPGGTIGWRSFTGSFSM